MLLNTEASSDKILLRQRGFLVSSPVKLETIYLSCGFRDSRKLYAWIVSNLIQFMRKYFLLIGRRVMWNNRNSTLLNRGYILRFFFTILSSSKMRKSFSCRTVQMLAQYMCILGRDIYNYFSFSI